ncbi:Hypothetical predicted protein [Pelobates cultripes]|uniref:Uncharacterized protein n=1 Tax=Pelobates cultripes TaxID=61616 RepID=A0AAD1SWU9_PELCU|nr:Hypothetical predicted protein [Pelobates cultripes]
MTREQLYRERKRWVEAADGASGRDPTRGTGGRQWKGPEDRFPAATKRTKSEGGKATEKR